jgi:hypothetical protein
MHKTSMTTVVQLKVGPQLQKLSFDVYEHLKKYVCKGKKARALKKVDFYSFTQSLHNKKYFAYIYIFQNFDMLQSNKC